MTAEILNSEIVKVAKAYAASLGVNEQRKVIAATCHELGVSDVDHVVDISNYLRGAWGKVVA